MSSIIKRCVSCGTELRGNYCHKCGQREIKKEDKRLRHFFEEAFASLFYADGKFFKTLRLLITKPGELSASFIGGIRKKYLSPLQLFFFANLVYFLFPVLSTFNTPLEVQLNGLPYSPVVERTVNSYVESSSISIEEFRMQYDQQSSSIGKLILIVLVLIHGLILRLLFMDKKQYYFEDFLATAAYFNSFYILIMLVGLPYAILGIAKVTGFSTQLVFSETILNIVFLSMSLIYMFFLIRYVFGTTLAGTLWRSVAFTVFMIPSFMIYRFILFWITYLVVT